MLETGTRFSLAAPALSPRNQEEVVRIARELRREAFNRIASLWTELRDAINDECYPFSPQKTVGTDASMAAVPSGCYRIQAVQLVVDKYVGLAGLWISATNYFLNTLGEDLRVADEAELLRLGEEFDQVTTRRSLISHMTLEDPGAVFIESVIPEFIDWWDDMWRAMEALIEAIRNLVDVIPKLPGEVLVPALVGLGVLTGLVALSVFT